MPDEIEAKMKVADLDAIRRRLIAVAAVKVGRTLETNTFFDTSDAALQSADSGLRLRINHPLDGGADTFVVTFKGPRRPGALKTREEIETTVDDPAATTALFERLGYRKGLTFQKLRETWKHRDCKVELDDLPRLGTFVEVEGPGEQSVLDVRTALKLDNQPMEKRGYADLLTAYLKAYGGTGTDVAFES